MNQDERSDNARATTGGDAPLGTDDQIGATIQLWRSPNRIWPAFPTLVVARAASRLGRGRNRGTVGEGGVVSVFIDGSKVGAIAPEEIKVYQISPGDHSLSLHFLGGLRRSKKVSVTLAEGEKKQFVCALNAFAWPSLRPATPEDVAAMEGSQSRPVGAAEPEAKAG
jgi:hypothetical protein